MGQRPLSDAGCLAGWATTDWELRPGLPGHRRFAPAPGVGPRHPAFLTHRRITAHLDGAPTQLPRLRRRFPPRHCAASGRTAYRGRGTRLRRVPFHGLRHSATTLLLERDLQLVVIKERCGDVHIGVTNRRVVYGVALTTTPAILSAPIDATRSRPSPGPTTVTDCRPEHHLSDGVAVSYCRPDITKAPPKSDPVGPLSSGQKSEPAFSQRRKGGISGISGDGDHVINAHARLNAPVETVSVITEHQVNFGGHQASVPECKSSGQSKGGIEVNASSVHMGVAFKLLAIVRVGPNHVPGLL
jgi:hypothetical protein